MQLHSMKCVKIFAEPSLSSQLTSVMDEIGIHVYATSHKHGPRFKKKNSKEEFITIEVITSDHLADILLQRLLSDFMPHSDILTYSTDVKVIRKEIYT